MHSVKELSGIIVISGFGYLYPEIFRLDAVFFGKVVYYLKKIGVILSYKSLFIPKIPADILSVHGAFADICTLPPERKGQALR